MDVCFIDVPDFSDDSIDDYQDALDVLVEALFKLYTSGQKVSLNLVTDRLNISSMANCGAGVSNVTVAPNGKLYLCPAFYYDEIRNTDNLLNYRFPSSSRSVGDIYGGLNIKNRELLDIDHAPICRICDAFHCHRCIWLNETLTGDANTPSHQQCVMAHIERNASRSLQQRLSNFNGCEITIDKVDYLDPFEIITRNEKSSR